MKHFTDTLYTSLLQEIEQLEEDNASSPAVQRIKILDVLHQRMEELKNRVLEQGFASTEEEIYFFKYQKPKISSLLIYHARLDMIELTKPEGTRQDLLCFYENELAAIRRFFNQNLPLYQYFRSEASYLDEKLFLRGRQDIAGLVSLLKLEADERFSTAADLLIARMMANEKLKAVLHQRIAQLEQPSAGLLASPPVRRLRWTGEAINLVEIAYGWHCTGQINHGQAGIAEIVRWLEENLGVSIGRPYRRFTEIKRRKLLSQTRFLDQMREAILRKLDEEDAFDPRKSANRLR